MGLGSAPVVNTDAISSIATTTAVCGGNVTLAGSQPPVTARGVCWSTSTIPTGIAVPIPSTKTVDGSGLGTYVSNLTSLSPGTLYYVRAYATSSFGNGYGNEVTFTTIASNPPTVTTDTITSITTTTAIGGGNVTSSGTSVVTVYGICWNTSPNPTTSNSLTTDGSGVHSFVSNLTSLTPSTLYHVRAYATNSVGTSYGSDVTFTTASPPMDIGQRISADISTQTSVLATVIQSDITTQVSDLTTEIVSNISTNNVSVASEISTQFANRHII